MMVVYDNAFGDTSVQNNVAIRDTQVSRYDKTSVNDPELRYVEAGVLAFERRLLDRIPPHGVVSLEQEVFPLLIAESQMAAYVTTQRFYTDIGTPERLEAFEALEETHDHHPYAVPHQLRRRRHRPARVLPAPAGAVSRRPSISTST